MSKKRLTNVHASVFVLRKHDFMADQTLITMNLTNFLSFLHPAVGDEEAGILSATTHHLTAQEAKKIASELLTAVATLEELEAEEKPE